jgi:hypothetical protein
MMTRTASPSDWASVAFVSNGIDPSIETPHLDAMLRPKWPAMAGLVKKPSTI